MALRVRTAMKITEYLHQYPEAIISGVGVVAGVAYRSVPKHDRYKLLRESYMEFNRRVRNAKIACVRAGISYEQSIEEGGDI